MRRASARTRRTAVIDSANSTPPGLQNGFYADAAATITASNNLISAWSIAIQPTGGSQPEYTDDSVTGGKGVRFSTGKTLSIPAGTLDTIVHSGGTIYLVARLCTLSPTYPFTIFDGTAGGTQKGFQLRVDTTRILRFRVWDGSSWVIDHTGEAAQSFQPLKWFVVGIAFSATGVTLSVDNAQPFYTDSFSVSLPTGATGALVLGDVAVDYAALEFFTPVHNRASIVANTVRLGARFSAPLVWTLAYDGVRNFSFPSRCRKNDGAYIDVYRDGLGHATNDGICIAANTTDLKTWSNVRTIVDFAATGSKGLHDPNICAAPFANGEIWVNYFEDAPGVGDHLNRIMYIKSSDGGSTWTTPARITNGVGYNLEVASAPIVEAYGKKYLPVYNGTDETGTTPWNAELYISSNDFSTITTVRVGTGTQVGSPGFSEWGVLDLGGDKMFGWLRSETDMYEIWSSDQGATWTAPVAASVVAHSAARIYYDSVRGKIYWLGRPNAILRSTLYERSTAIQGTGSWNALPAAITINASPGTCIYGAIVPGTASGKLAIISGSQIGAIVSDTNAAIYSQEVDDFVPNGDMPLVITPASLTCAASATQQFTAKGAGGFTWSLSTNGTGGSIDANGLYTAGAFTGTDVVRVTDLNGFTKDATVTVSGSSFVPWSLSSCLLWIDSDASAPTTSGGNLVSWTDQKSGNNIIPGNGTAVPVTTSNASFSNKPSVHTGTGAFMKTTSALALGSFTQVACLKTTAIGYITVHNSDAGDGGYWFTSGPASFVQRSGTGQSTASVAFDTAVTTGNAVVAMVKFDGADRTNNRMLVDGVARTIDSITAVNPGTATQAGVVYIGANSTAGGNLVADYAAYGAFDGTMSDADRANVREYCRRKFGTA